MTTPAPSRPPDGSPSVPPPGALHGVRSLGPGDAEASRRLGWEAFGAPSDADPASTPAPPAPGMRPWGLFERGELVARIVDREYESWFGGSRIPTSGIAGVTVAAEHRGGGKLFPLFTAVLEDARKRGSAISTLFPTAPGIYRKFGFEVVARFETVEVPTAVLAAVRGGDRLRVRRGAAADVVAARDVYDTWAAAQNGPLTRRGVSFPATAEDLAGSFTGITLAVDARERVHGYALWRRGPGYGEASRIDVRDLVATDPDATRALLRTVGSFASVAPTTRIDTSGDDLARYVLPTNDWRVVDSEQYMLRILDPAQAIGLRRFPAHLSADLTFSLADELLPDLAGAWRLSVEGGRATCSRSEDAAVLHFTARGLALCYAGAQSTANLRMAGLLEGDRRDDDLWDSLFGGRQLHVRDYF